MHMRTMRHFRTSGTARTAGFTLIEVMVVMAILATLMGSGFLMLRKAQSQRMKTECQTRLSSLGAALERLRAPECIGMYPPTATESLVGPGKSGSSVGKTLGSNNGVNVGIETLYVAVRLKGVNIPVDAFEGEGALGNTDADSAAAVVPDLAKPDLYEYLDPWGNPFVYLSARDYKAPQKVERYVRGDGTEVKVAPMVKSNGEFVRADSYQLFSMGPDGQPGTEDDVQFGVQ